ncbi:MAG: ketoacyl-ACP synthase III [Bacteroidota bacterium]|jgi:3-oxoacyl-[acyl-carrier-protein] synthase-3
MALIELKNLSIRGVASCVPKNETSNIDYNYISQTERDLFIKTTGIAKRRVAPQHISTGDLLYSAAKELLNSLKWSNDEVDAIITITQSPDYFIPGTAVMLQNKLSLKKTTIAFDVNLGCSGYVYGLFIAGNLMQSGNIKKVILCVGDKSSSSTCEQDKSTYPLFGDAGSATAIEYDSDAKESYFNLMTDGSGHEAIMISDGGSRNGIRKETFELKEVAPGVIRAGRHLQLNGVEIFNFAVREVPNAIKELYEFAGKLLENTDYFVLHQANKFINESVRKKMKSVPAEKFLYSIESFGNTSSASIPLTMTENFKNIENGKTNELCLCGFGVGFSWGACIVNAEKTVFLPLIEIE